MHDRREIQQLKLAYQQQLPHQMTTAVIALDENLIVQYINPAAEALLVKSLHNLHGLLIDDVLLNCSITGQRFRQLLATGQEFSDSDVSFMLLDGSSISVEVNVSAAEFNGVAHILIELRQIDHQKQISQEANQQQQWEAARDLIRGLAHEIKNPLGGLRGAAQLLNKELSQEQQEYTKMIIEQSDRLTNLVDKLLGPNQLPNMINQNIHLVLEKVHKLTSFNNPKQITIRRDYDPSIPEICFDEDKLQQAVLNIVNNAVLVLPDNGEGSITLKTRIASNKTINGKRVRLCIEISILDNGPGIPVNIQDTLFYPMISGRNNGTGLGLSISQTLIHQHQGKLSCKSRPGRTEFTILLPLPEESLK
ncbi:nitrogen regulation protein NR(II) [Thalassotalea sp. PLHSN55]|uniref:nitrogen regulation protein NR(II) n=1 Tax=Thalassotalea sp. PLHSN55 TaxID=3435888 RepID=UPI003F857957